MSKQDSENPDVVSVTIAGSAVGANSINSGRQDSMNQIDLLKVNVNDHTENKQGLTYLSWAWAWAEALKADPHANFQIQMFDGKPYLEINDTAMVFVTVCMFNKPVTCFLPVMNGANKPITFSGREVQTRNGRIIEKIDSFNVNTAIMRCLTKGLALHGLGLYIYAGEDLPEGDAEPEPAPKAAEKKAPPAISEQDDANARLFAEGIEQYMFVATTEKGLRSYWKENEVALNKLKETHPALYEGILAAFKKTAAQLKEKANA